MPTNNTLIKYDDDIILPLFVIIKASGSYNIKL